jgi:hypothetical protein
MIAACISGNVRDLTVEECLVIHAIGTGIIHVPVVEKRKKGMVRE